MSEPNLDLSERLQMAINAVKRINADKRSCNHLIYVQQVGSIVLENADVVIQALKMVEREQLNMPIAWGLTKGEVTLMRELMDKTLLSYEQILAAAGSRGEPRAIVHRLNQKLGRVMPLVRIHRAVGRGYGIKPEDKATIRTKSAEA